MQVTPYFAATCATSAIQNLGLHTNAEEALLSFCKMELAHPGSTFGPAKEGYRTIASHYAFVAGPEVPQDAPGGSHHSKAWVRYGSEFAAFLIEHGLGTVVTTGPVLNLKHHAKSTCQAWFWTPNQKALEAWYETHRK